MVELIKKSGSSFTPVFSASGISGIIGVSVMAQEIPRTPETYLLNGLSVSVAKTP